MGYDDNLHKENFSNSKTENAINYSQTFSEQQPSLTEKQLTQAKILHTHLQNNTGFTNADPLYQVALNAVKNFDIFRPSFFKLTKKANNLCLGFALKGYKAFFHEKKLLGIGHFKATYSATLYSFQSQATKPIVHQKIQAKKRSQAIVTMKKREANLPQFLSHPHIVKVYGCNLYGTTTNPKLAIYAEKCDYDLDYAIRHDKLSHSEKKEIMIGIAEALSFIHDKGYSHNDIKPDNIMVKNKKGKLADFGFCFLDEQGNKFLGFKKIQAPEQRNLKDQFPSRQSDVYQFGLTLWHLFHPAPPSQHLSLNFNYPTEMFANWPITEKSDATMQQLIQSCLDENPSKRPSMEDVKAALNTTDV